MDQQAEKEVFLKYGFIYPGGEARQAANIARVAEAAGWDGFFVWEPVWGVDAWVSLTAAAMQTERIRLGTMITPVSRCRPWKLASETATLDRLSNGRVILSVALGAVETGFIQFGEETDRKVRAELLDEGLEILTGLWKGQPFNFDGKHYHIQELDHFPPPPPIQQPRIPVWVVGLWPRPKSMQRVTRFDGLLPAIKNPDGSHAEITPGAVRQMKAYLNEHCQATHPMDIVIEGGHTLPEDRQAAVEKATALEEAGATWWLESMWDVLETMWEPETQMHIRHRVEQGPPSAALGQR
jgi:alkanesulfonate monooxygenase SsuD/methylene tetrahydromethanopterin reductase-like flavin-dependent oxidoreductase (luciferase family)